MDNQENMIPNTNPESVNLTITVNAEPAPAAPAPAPVETPAASECCCCASADELKQEEAAPAEAPAAPETEEVVENTTAEEAPVAVEEAAPAEAAEEVQTPAAESDTEADKVAENNTESEPGKRPAKREFKAPASVTPESLEEVKSILQEMFRFLDLQGDIAIENRGRSVNLLISSNEPGKIIGHHGTNLDSLQIILNRVVQKKYKDYAKIYIDIASSDSDPRPRRKNRDEESGDTPRFGKSPREARRSRDGERRDRRERGDRREFGRKDDRFSGRPRRDNDEERGPRMGHDEKLRMQAKDAAKEVRLFGDKKTLPPMNPHDRRIIHMTLENEEGIITESVGEGDTRSVVISLKD